MATQAASDGTGYLFADLSQDGLAAGQLTFTVPGSPDAVHDMLLDFDHATGKRPWAREYSVLEREDNRVLALWKFRGKLGVNPTVELEFLTNHDGELTRISYRIAKNAFGLKTFEGALLLLPIEDNRTVVSESVFIDSGLPIANATLDDIKKGLRADAEHMQAWMLERGLVKAD